MALLLILFLFALLGVYVASEKNRAAVEGFALGCLLGPFGVIVEALLPTKTKRDLAGAMRADADDRIRELNELPLVYDEPQVTDDDVDRFITG